MSGLSNSKSVTSRPSGSGGKVFFFSAYLLLGVKLIVPLFIGFMLVSEILDYRAQNKSEQETPEPNTGFLYYDLPLSEWAQGFIIPIAGARVPNNRNLLPGAPRAYRNGKHEGVDLFCDFSTPVLAAKSGYVILARKNYVDTPRNYRNRLLELSKRLYQTPPEILEVLHGRRVVVDHGVISGRWVTTVYSHLSQIKEGLKVGDRVNQGDIIGYVGNSGTSKTGARQGAHLHFEIRANGHYLGEGMSAQEAGQLLKAIMGRSLNGQPD